MAGTLKTSQFNSATVANPTDEVPLLQGGQLKRVQVKVLTGNPDVGWQAAAETWSFSSWNSTLHIGVITVPSDATTKYAVGMWVRISQATGGTKYGKIIAVTSTSLSVNFPKGVTFTNETISTPFYSPLARPVGSPDDSQFVHSMTNAGSGGGTLNFMYNNGVKEVWGKTASFSGAAGGQTTLSITFPSGFFSSNPDFGVVSNYANISNAKQWCFLQNAATTTGVSIAAIADGAYSGYMTYRIRGV